MDDYVDRRARLGPANRAMEAVLGPNECDNLLHPLWATKGIVFPYTPDVLFTRNANYNDFHFTHSNYRYNQYQNSGVSEIQLVSEFAVQTNEEGRYLLATIRFLQSVTMSEFGLSTPLEKRGTPPPVLRFNYLGEQMFRSVPVVVSMVTFNLDRTIDYVPVTLPSTAPSGGAVTHVPTKMIVTTQLLIQPSPQKVRDKFSVGKFKQGKLIGEGFI